MNDINERIAQLFEKTAESLEKGEIGSSIPIGITTIGNEHGHNTMIEGAILAKKLYPNVEIVLIGEENDTGFETVVVDNTRDMNIVMEEYLDTGVIKAAVTMNYNFPVGVSTVGKYISPSTGMPVYISATAGLSSQGKISCLIKNAINGIIVAKATGVKKPSIGMLNVEGAGIAKKILCEIIKSGYEIDLGQSIRYKEEDVILRGNDLINPNVDVIVCDTLTGNMIIKFFSTYASGGNFEATGHGYGPAVGDGWEKNIVIISAASGPAVIANAVKYAYDMVKGEISRVSRREYRKLSQTDYLTLIRNKTDHIIPAITEDFSLVNENDVGNEIRKCQEFTETIVGIDMMEVDSAKKILDDNNIENVIAMGCVSPVIKVSMDDLAQSLKILKEKGFL